MLTRILILCIVMLSSGISYAQGTVAVSEQVSKASYWSNPLFWIMVFAIVALLFVIVGMGIVLIGLAENKKSESAVIEKTAGLTIVGFLLLSTQNASAQSIGTTVGLDTTTFGILLSVLVIELLMILYLYFIMRKMIYTLGYEKKVKSKWAWSSILKNITDSGPIEKESELATTHNYDGIIELDNNLPPWWKYMFYVSIVFAFAYMYYYHFGSGKLQIAEYEESIQIAQQMKQATLKQSTNSVDENNVIYLSDETSIGKGKTSYATKCAVCHGQEGEGGVGPNLTDEYWIHGGSIKDIFKTIKYGVPEKGMIPWEAQVPPVEMQMIASYIKSLEGTNPANAKEPQGEIYKEVIATTSTDSTQTSNTVAQ